MASPVFGPPTQAQLWNGYNAAGTGGFLTSLFKGGSVIPIPSFTGGSAGPSLAESMNTGGNIGPVNFGGFNFKSSSWLQYAVIGIVVIGGIYVWRKK